MKTFPSASFCLFLALLLSCLASVPQRANATTRTVTSLADSGTGTLRDTIAASAANDSIVFSVTGTITLTSGELVIGRNLTITGPTGGVTVSGNNASRVFNIQTGTVNLSNLTLINGNPFGGVGGGIYNHNGANLTLNNCTISGNFSCGIIIDGSSGPTPFASLYNCTIFGNDGDDCGGILMAYAGTLHLEPVLNFLKELSVHCIYLPALSWG